MLFASGQIPINPATGNVETTTIEEQTEQVMKNIGAILIEAGVGYEDVVKTTCFLADMNDFQAFNSVYERYFPGKPARSCVAVKQLPKNVLCEVEVIASLYDRNDRKVEFLRKRIVSAVMRRNSHDGSSTITGKNEFELKVKA